MLIEYCSNTAVVVLIAISSYHSEPTNTPFSPPEGSPSLHLSLPWRTLSSTLLLVNVPSLRYWHQQYPGVFPPSPSWLPSVVGVASRWNRRFPATFHTSPRIYMYQYVLRTDVFTQTLEKHQLRGSSIPPKLTYLQYI